MSNTHQGLTFTWVVRNGDPSPSGIGGPPSKFFANLYGVRIDRKQTSLSSMQGLCFFLRQPPPQEGCTRRVTGKRHTNRAMPNEQCAFGSINTVIGCQTIRHDHGTHALRQGLIDLASPLIITLIVFQVAQNSFHHLGRTAHHSCTYVSNMIF